MPRSSSSSAATKKARQRLASTAAKKGLVPDKSAFASKTRQSAELESEDPKVKTFSKANFQAAKTESQVRFQLQELATFVMQQYRRLNITMREKASFTAFLLKQFQKGQSNFVYLKSETGIAD